MTEQIVIPPVGEYVVDTARSTLRFATRHMFGLGGVKGSFSLAGGKIAVADPVTESTAEADIDAASFTTGSNARDKTVKSKQYLHATENPVIAFRNGRVREENGEWVLEGELTVRGTTGPLALKLDRAEMDGGTFVASAKTRVDRYAFGVTAQKGMTGRYLDMELNVVADKA